MGAGKRTVVECTLVHLLVTAVAILLALAVTFLLTYYLTKDAYTTDTHVMHSKLLLCVSVILHIIVIETQETVVDGDEKKEDHSPTAAQLRLPKAIRPLGYDLKMQTYLPSYVDFPSSKDFTFDAELNIDLDVVEAEDKIVLNMRNLTIDKDKSELYVNGQKVGIVRIVPQEKLEKVEIVPATRLQQGAQTKLKLVYAGLISNKLGGLYQTTYTENDGSKKVAAVTQMEPIDARSMVPCFDEPEFKAAWNVTVIHPRGTKAISNGIEEREEQDGDWVTTKFSQTPKMSSYLLAVLVSEFEYIQNHTSTGVLFRIWSRKEATSMTKYALQAGIKCLDYYEKLFNYSFPLKKQDMVALPDFSAGAMENWGLITYRESALLYDENLYGPDNKRRVALVVAHELGHQWFGNLVTLKWWEDLWLNEGFATYLEFLGTDVISDNLMKMDQFFILDSMESGMDEDSLSSSHPLSFKIDKANEVYEAFDSISYGKGGSILKMIAATIGKDNLIKGVAHYIRKHAYNNAEAADLWAALNEVVGSIHGSPDDMKVGDFADQWTAQMGFPLVTVESFNETHVKLTQERYRKNQYAKDPEKYANPKYGFKWDVPIWYQEGDSSVQLSWLKREEPLYLQLNKPEHFVVINAGRNGFYRQNYDAAGWQKITKQLKDNHQRVAQQIMNQIYNQRFKAHSLVYITLQKATVTKYPFPIFDVFTRNALISDAFATALVDKVSYETILDLLQYLKAEEDYLPWEAAIDGFNDLLRYFGNEPEVKYAKQFMLSLANPLYQKTDLKHIADEYKNDKLFLEILLEQDVVNFACKLDLSECKTNYKKLFDDEVVAKCQGNDSVASQCVTLAAPLRSKTYCYGVEEGGDAAYEKVMGLYLAEPVQLEKNRLRDALACTRDITSLKELMLLSLDRNSSFVRLQDVDYNFRSVANNPVGQEIIFSFFIEHWDDIYDGLMPERSTIGNIIKKAALGIRSQHQIEQLKSLKKNGRHASEFGDFNEAIEKSEHKVEWINKHFRELSNIFKKFTE